LFRCMLNWKLSNWDIDQVYQASASTAAAPQEPTMATDDNAPTPTPPADTPAGPAPAPTPTDAKKQAKRAAKAARKAAIASQRARRK
jgi:pyruvate dehydrogenase E2 component (dihydrolipoyllysine-residue acetyltransferase)